MVKIKDKRIITEKRWFWWYGWWWITSRIGLIGSRKVEGCYLNKIG
jgi:hypothetical protein